MSLDLDHLQALCDAATEGPWTVQRGYGYISQRASFAVEREGNHPDETISIVDEGHVEGPDASFIAAARTALPALIARVRELEAMLHENHELVHSLSAGAGVLREAIVAQFKYEEGEGGDFYDIEDKMHAAHVKLGLVPKEK